MADNGYWSLFVSSVTSYKGIHPPRAAAAGHTTDTIPSTTDTVASPGPASSSAPITFWSENRSQVTGATQVEVNNTLRFCFRLPLMLTCTSN